MRLSDPPRVFVVACMAAIGGTMLCAGLALIGYALAGGSTPMLWLWLMAFAGLLVLRRACWLLRRLRDPRAWQRPRHTPASLAVWALGLCLVFAALIFDADGRARTLAVLVGGSMFILSSLLMRKP